MSGVVCDQIPPDSCSMIVGSEFTSPNAALIPLAAVLLKTLQVSLSFIRLTA